MEPVFALASESDAGTLVGLMREFYAVEHLLFDEDVARGALRQVLGNSIYGRVYLIKLGGEVAGYVALTFGFSLEFRGRHAVVDELYVREAFRRRGVGRAALLLAEDVCREEGFAAVRLEVDVENEGAQGLYRRVGYQEHDRYLMTRWLPQR